VTLQAAINPRKHHNLTKVTGKLRIHFCLGHTNKTHADGDSKLAERRKLVVFVCFLLAATTSPFSVIAMWVS
jgi:hypothetical protein